MYVYHTQQFIKKKNINMRMKMMKRPAKEEILRKKELLPGSLRTKFLKNLFLNVHKKILKIKPRRFHVRNIFSSYDDYYIGCI